MSWIVTIRAQANPERFPLYYRGFRRVLAHRFPYRIFFRVLHGEQDHPSQLRP